MCFSDGELREYPLTSYNIGLALGDLAQEIHQCRGFAVTVRTDKPEL